MGEEGRGEGEEDTGEVEEEDDPLAGAAEGRRSSFHGGHQCWGDEYKGGILYIGLVGEDDRFVEFVRTELGFSSRSDKTWLDRVEENNQPLLAHLIVIKFKFPLFIFMLIWV